MTTKDTKTSNVTYTTTDKLYALQGDYSNDKYLWAGSSDSTVLAMSSYWSSGDGFWLRSPYVHDDYVALLADPGGCVDYFDVSFGFAVQPASNLNLSSVLFASAATAASSGTVSNTIASETAMTLRLDGTGRNIGTVTYNTTTGDIKAAKESTEGNVALVVQGRGTVNGEEKDWYYSKQITGTETVNVSAIVSESNTPSSIDLSTCKIWLETTDSTGNLIYAVGATEVLSITSVAITGIETPVANATLDTSASCATTGVNSTTPQIIWTPSDSTARYNTSYTASIILTADTGYEFADTVTATISESAATSVNKNADGTLTVTYEFLSTAKRKIDSVTAPTVPTNNTFTTYYGYEGYDASPISGSNSELGEAATVTFEGTVAPTTGTMDVTWTIESAGGGAYDKTPGAENIFRWTIPADELTNYDASVCQGYDADIGNITGTVMIKNKAATPVNITGTDSGISYTGETIDVSPYFTIDTHAGTATYSLITGTDGGTGEGTLTGTTLTVTKTGTFKIKVNTAANGIYGAGEGNITLTVANGTIEYTITATAGANGSISPGGAVGVAAGGSQTFTISPSSGYVIDTLKVDGLEVTATTSYTFSEVNSNHTIEVNFKQESQTPDVPDDSGKKVEAPNTGDDTPSVLLFILTIISGTGLILTAKKRRKNLKMSEK